MSRFKNLVEKYKKSEISDKKKIENMVYILLMLIIIVIGINKIWFEDNDKRELKETQEETTTTLNNIESNDSLEERLKNILEKVDGVNNVSVLINYSETKQIQPVYNVEEKETTTNESDTQGGNRNIVEKDYSKQIVYEENNNSKSIIIQKEEKPKISGVIVVASFNKNDEIRQQIIKAVANIANISEYKVQVLSGN